LALALCPGTCINPRRLAVEASQNTTLQGINTCDAEDSNRGFLNSLDGKDYVVMLEAADHQRIVTVTTSASKAGPEYDTFLAASTQCTSTQTLDAVVRVPTWPHSFSQSQSW